MTKKALSSKLNTNFINVDVLNRADGLQLWQMIIQEFQPLPKDEMELEDIKQEFLKLSKFSGESDQAYLEQFQLKIKSMEHYHIAPPQHQQVIIFLKGFKDARLTTPILELRQKHSASFYSDWVRAGNLRHSMERANNYCHLVNQYTPTAPPRSTLPRLSPPVILRSPQPPTIPPNTPNLPQPRYTDPPVATTSPMNATNLEQLETQFKNELLSADRTQDFFFNWRNKNRRGCIFHPAQNHKFLKCHLTESICQECNLDNELSTAVFNLQQSTRRLLAERGVDPNTTTMQPTPYQPHAQARRVTSPVIPPHLPSPPAPSPPTPPRSCEDVESDHSHSSLISINNRVGPYLCKNHSNQNILSQFPKSILFPAKTQKRVTFQSSYPTQPSIQKESLELKSLPTRDATSLAIPDSGATHDMTSIKALFEYLVPFKTPLQATLGDETTQLPVIAYGMMNYFLRNKRVRRMGYYVPTLGTTLLSIKQHIKYDGCYFHAEKNNVTLAFPAHLIYPNITSELTVLITPANGSSEPYIFDEFEAIFLLRSKTKISGYKSKYGKVFKFTGL